MSGPPAAVPASIAANGRHRPARSARAMSLDIMSTTARSSATSSGPGSAASGCRACRTEYGESSPSRDCTTNQVMADACARGPW